MCCSRSNFVENKNKKLTFKVYLNQNLKHSKELRGKDA